MEGHRAVRIGWGEGGSLVPDAPLSGAVCGLGGEAIAVSELGVSRIRRRLSREAVPSTASNGITSTDQMNCQRCVAAFGRDGHHPWVEWGLRALIKKPPPRTAHTFGIPVTAGAAHSSGVGRPLRVRAWRIVHAVLALTR